MSDTREAGRELDAEIAVRVFGYFDVGEFEGQLVHGENNMNGWPMPTPHYSTDSTAARLMEDEITRRSDLGNIQGLHVSYALALSHIVGFPGFSCLGWTDLFRYVTATPLQRCLAALAALATDSPKSALEGAASLSSEGDRE